MQSLSGKLLQIRYSSDDGSYTVADFLTDENEELTVVGTLAGVNAGEKIKLTGEYTQHAIYGRQFKVAYYEPVKLTDKDSIVEYLASGVISSVGTKFAQKIADRFGENTFDVIENHPDRLLEIDGIGPKKLDKIITSYNENFAVKSVIIYLAKYAISSNMAVKLYNVYKENTISTLTKNPYILCRDVRGISFKKADEIARKLGAGIDSDERKYQAILFVLEEAAFRGHTFMYFDDLSFQIKELIDYDDKDGLYDLLLELCEKKSVVLSGQSENLRVYSYSYEKAETNAAIALMRLATAQKESFDSKKAKEIIRELTENGDIQYSDEQISCAYKAAENSVLIITGGPGTGKTTTLFLLISLFEKMDKKIKLCAPTGKASKRMTQATGKDACTIHRLLEVGFSDESGEEVFMKDEDEPIDADIIIVDEVSMVDIKLMNNLLSAVKDGTHLILVGDKDQLPSVGAGNVLNDMLKSEMLPCVKLEKIFRQAQKSGIVVNAHKINTGQGIFSDEKYPDFFIMQRDNTHLARELVSELAVSRLPRYYGITPKDIQVIAPMKKGILGTTELNTMLQDSINPKDTLKGEYKDRFRVFREGDRIIHVKNNYEKQWQTDDLKGTGIFNGETGIIKIIDKKNSFLTVEFDDGKRTYYDFDELNEIQLAYALTVHKSQGSEYKAVILPILSVAPMLLTRKILYTAMTRAKELLVIISDKKTLGKMIDNVYEESRNSALAEKLTMFKDALCVND